MDIDKDAIKLLYSSSPLAPIVFRHLGKKERDVPRTDLRRLRLSIIHDEDIEVDVEEFLSIFERLDKLGFGKLIRSKERDVPHRFKWSDGVLAALELIEGAIGSAKPAQGAATPPPQSVPFSSQGVAMFQLRPGFWLKLPADITPSELRSIQEFAQALRQA